MRLLIGKSYAFRVDIRPAGVSKTVASGEEIGAGTILTFHNW
jgi:hypothetical protein